MLLFTLNFWQHPFRNLARYIGVDRLVCNRLEFRADGSNGVGGLLDNIVVEHTGPSHAALTEQLTPAGDLTASGAIAFTDADRGDMHLASAVDATAGGALGSLTATVSSDTGTGTGGQLTWSYAVADAAVEYLAAGETKVESFTISLDDQHGGVATRQVDVALNGTNDAPVIAAVDRSQGASFSENPGIAGDSSHHTATGLIHFTDADLSDRPSGIMFGQLWSYTAGDGRPLPMTEQQINALFSAFRFTNDPGNTNNGVVRWTFDAPDQQFVGGVAGF